MKRERKGRVLETENVRKRNAKVKEGRERETEKKNIYIERE